MIDREVPLRLHHIAQLKKAVGHSLEEATITVRSTKSQCNSSRTREDLVYETEYYVDVIGNLPI